MATFQPETDHPLWREFEEFAKTRIPIREQVFLDGDPSSWMGWWDCFLAGARAADPGVPKTKLWGD